MSQHHLRSLRLASALVDSCLRQKYSWLRLRGDALAGITVGIGAIPLSMALSVAIGLPPQHGLYTALISGFVIALLGGSRYSVSGPAAAFVVVLHPIVMQYGLSGLLLASLMGGVILLALGLVRFGRVISYIPASVTLGFTLGIAFILAVMQIPDLLGLQITGPTNNNISARLANLFFAVDSFYWPSLCVSAVTLVVMLLWPRLRLPVPAHLPAMIVGAFSALLLAHYDLPVDTIATHFHYINENGATVAGIPPLLPQFIWPWQVGEPWSLAWVTALLPAAFSIAMLGAIQSLLCAVMLDKASATHHQPNTELVAQGLGNILVPFFGGFAATAALARSATSFRAGASSPLAAMINALVIGICLFGFTTWLAYLPMASMAVLLMIVAWTMCERQQVWRLLKKAPAGDIAVLLLCATLTVWVDMVTAIVTGVVIAALLFMRDIAQMTRVTDISQHNKHVPEPLPEHWAVYKITGPLFFAAAEHVFAELEQLARDKRGVVLYMDAVALLDAGGLEGLNQFRSWCKTRDIVLVLADVQFQPLKSLVKAGVQSVAGELLVFATLAEALAALPLSESHVNVSPV